MNNFREGLNALREISDPEKAKLILEKIIGKKIADYEGIDALVGALMGYYNGELGKIDTKFKNLSFIPVPVGGILLMYNTSNPAELYPNTTWELLATDKYLKTTTGTPLSLGGSNSLKLSKANLPAEKLQIDSFQLGKGTQEITGSLDPVYHDGGAYINAKGAMYIGGSSRRANAGGSGQAHSLQFQASRTWTGMSTSATPYTTAMGSGTPLTINPEHITVRAWKRLT